MVAMGWGNFSMDRFGSTALLAAAIVWCAPGKAEEPDVARTVTNPTVPFKMGFAGAYIAATGGYDLSAPGQTDQNANFNNPLTSFDTIRGGKIGGLIGYNATSDRLLLGFEARAQYAFGADANSSSYSYSNPLPVNLGTCFGCGPGAYQAGPTPLVQAETFTERISRPFSGDFSLRAGIIFDDWLI
jgi:hypothetical protein